MVRRGRDIIVGFGEVSCGIQKNDIFNGVLENEGTQVNWSKIEIINADTGPCARWMLTATTLANGDLFIHGGLDSSNKAQQDTWKFKFDSNEWEQLQDGLEPKFCHSADIVGSLVVFIGGIEG